MLKAIIGLIFVLVFAALIIACYKLGYADGMSKGMDIMAEQGRRSMESLVSAMEEGNGTRNT